MNNAITSTDRLRGSFLGMFIGDALAMPVHWYCDNEALVNDYGKVTDYLRPHNPHPDSFLWRSSYTPPPGTTDIRHDQEQYWGKRDIHYHQFFRAGKNTLNQCLDWFGNPVRDWAHLHTNHIKHALPNQVPPSQTHRCFPNQFEKISVYL